MKEKYIEKVISLIKNKKIKNSSLETAGPFSFIGLNFNDKFRLKVEYNIIGDVSFWKKTIKEYEFFIINIDDDKTVQINKDDFSKIINTLKQIDTDTVNNFLCYSFCK